MTCFLEHPVCVDYFCYDCKYVMYCKIVIESNDFMFHLFWCNYQFQIIEKETNVIQPWLDQNVI